jgi:hypothetical protein
VCLTEEPLRARIFTELATPVETPTVTWRVFELIPITRDVKCVSTLGAEYGLRRDECGIRRVRTCTESRGAKRTESELVA